MQVQEASMKQECQWLKEALKSNRMIQFCGDNPIYCCLKFKNFHVEDSIYTIVVHKLLIPITPFCHDRTHTTFAIIALAFLLLNGKSVLSYNMILLVATYNIGIFILLFLLWS